MKSRKWKGCSIQQRCRGVRKLYKAIQQFITLIFWSYDLLQLRIILKIHYIFGLSILRIVKSDWNVSMKCDFKSVFMKSINFSKRNILWSINFLMYFLCPLISFHGHVDSNFALNIHINCTLTERSPPFLFKPMYDKTLLYILSPILSSTRTTYTNKK